MRIKRWMSFLLCLVFCISLLPVSALADGDRYLEINEANFPDATFRQWVIDNLAGGKDYMTQAEVESVIIINTSSGISTLMGIEHFPALEELHCTWNQLTSLDVSHNTALKELDVSHNQLTTLDVSHNNALKKLFLFGNQLSALNVNHNTALEELNCGDNQLTALDVSQNMALEGLRCDWNQLTALDVSHNPALQKLDCNNNRLTALDVSHNTALRYLDCYSNQLTTLDVSHNTALEQLECYGNQLTALDVSHNMVLEWLRCGSNRLTVLDVTQNTTLQDLRCGGNQLTALDVSRNTALELLWCDDNQLTALDVSHNMTLNELTCDNNQLTALEVTHNTALKWLWCPKNKLTTLDVSHNTALIELVCHSNQLTELDMSRNTALLSLDCTGNHIPTLDLSANAALKTVKLEQMIEDQTLTYDGENYQYDLSKFVPLANMAKVTVSGEGQLNKDTGLVTFTKKVYKLTYQYATGHGAMDVNVLFIAPPTITAQPKNVNVQSGQKATFTVEAKGGGNIEYQWFSRPYTYADWVLIDGATSNTYTVIGTKDNDGWQFRCRAKNEGSEVYSDAATLTVTLGAPPTIKTQPKDAKVKSGSKAKFSVKVKEKNVTFQWFSKAPGAADWTAIAGETKATLTMVGSKANTGTQYRCRVRTAAGGEAYSNIATLTVKIQPPVIKTQPKSLSVKSGKKAKFTVKASGKNITYQWVGRTDANSEWKPVPGGNKKDLTIVASKANNGSQYYCYLKNADGDATSVTVTLTVTPEAAPTIKTHPKDAKARLGGKAKFKVKASVKNVSYQWYYRTSETGEWVLMEGATSAILIVVAYEDNIGWQFRCRVWNDDGEVYSNAATLRKTVKQPSTAGDAK